MSPADIIVLVLIALATVGAWIWHRKTKKAGRGCCGDCSQCGKNCRK